ncbi:MAG: ATP-binding protein [Actinomycetota bacterium]|nr:ATP-binding protein [Actinomycetota bacterium]
MPAQLTVLSGKGGTGKTTVAATFLSLAGGAVAADCDVDAPNLHLLLDSTLVSREPFEGALVAHINPEKCVQCTICEESCPFGAIKDLTVDPYSCEGCGVCELVCQDDAARLLPAITGELFVSETRFGPLAHALLRPGGEASGKLVTRVKEAALRLAGERGLGLIVVDGSPGIGCPVIASVSGSDLILAVAEPTLSGLWGLERIHGVAKHFGVKMAVCINKDGINPEIAEQVRHYCSESKLQVLGEVPFDEEVNQATMNGEVLVERYGGPAANALKDLWEQTIALLESVKTKT